ncbi:hypothetical protein [Inquilinus limosus]|uniref:hypothetical protein n=1 Tax=Inquilinus limosus TaxID=171674 RepID=UPI00040D8ED6|nr:hypothetical protein [Inquilinus limosus]
MSKKASLDKLAALHAQLAEALADALTPTTDPETGAVEKPSAAVMAQAIAFLKLNNITADAETDPALQRLAQAAHKQLPDFTNIGEDGHPVVN